MNSVHYLTDLSHPATQAVLLIAIALFEVCRRHYRTSAAFAALGILWITLCATPAFTGSLQRGLESQYPAREAAQLPTAEAIVVLGGGEALDVRQVGGDAVRSVQATRAGFALALFREQRAPIVLLSGGLGEADEMAHELEQSGVPADALQVEDASATTYENALLSANILKRDGRRRILLVTSSWSMPRAAACFRQQGLEVIAAPALDRIDMPKADASWRPDWASLRQSARFLHEYIGLVYYRLRGWA